MNFIWHVTQKLFFLFNELQNWEEEILELKQSMAGKYEEGFEYAIEQSEGLVPLH
jgi:hypothetical protein